MENIRHNPNVLSLEKENGFSELVSVLTLPELTELIKFSDAKPFQGVKGRPWFSTHGLSITIPSLDFIRSPYERAGLCEKFGSIESFIQGNNKILLSRRLSFEILSTFYLLSGRWEDCPHNFPQEGPQWKKYQCRFVEFLVEETIPLSSFVWSAKNPAGCSFRVPIEMIERMESRRIYEDKKSVRSPKYLQFVFGDYRITGTASNGYLPVVPFPLIYQYAYLTCDNPADLKILYGKIEEINQEVADVFLVRFGRQLQTFPAEHSSRVLISRRGNFTDYSRRPDAVKKLKSNAPTQSLSVLSA